MLRKIKRDQKRNNETHIATHCDAIELDIFSYGRKKYEMRG
ncbi:hypothetical protein [Faecalibaculum rodentium]|nr:hypothetical protein [Faecalibaculum rodentium]